VLTRNSTHTHNNRDKVNPPVPHLRRVIAVVGMQTEAHNDTVGLHRKIPIENEIITRKTRKTCKAYKAYTNRTNIPHSPSGLIDSLVEEAVLWFYPRMQQVHQLHRRYTYPAIPGIYRCQCKRRVSLHRLGLAWSMRGRVLVRGLAPVQ
jgi:hypothetical protein